MQYGRSLLSASLLLGLTLCCSCGSNAANRQLLSITISPTSANATTGAVQFTATGTFNTDPKMVSPLAASWTLSGPGIDPVCSNNCQYQITPGPFTPTCGPAGVDTVTAVAPADPNAPSSGPEAGTQLVSATAQVTCP